jgi:DNA-binding MarR family transcriptional regulator
VDPSREQATRDIMRTTHELFHALRPATVDWMSLDLTLAQVKALFTLSGRAPLTVGAMGQLLRIQLPAASHAVKSLVRLDLARRLKDPNDRRCTYIQLTPHGQKLADELREGRRDTFLAWLEELTDEDLAAAQRGFLAIAAVAARHESENAGASAQPGLDGGSAGDPYCGPCAAGPDIRDLEEETQWQ